MTLKEHIYSVLVVSSSDKFNEQLSRLLSEAVYSPIHYAASINQAQCTVLERPYDIVLINTPLPDDFGIKFAIDLSSDKMSVVMLFVHNDFYLNVYDKVCDYGIFTIRKPTGTSTIMIGLDWLKSTRERLRRLENNTLSLQEKMAEIKLINRAKWTLIDSLKMTEADAHRYIEKQAMDRGVTRREIAEMIIKTYQ